MIKFVKKMVLFSVAFVLLFSGRFFTSQRQVFAESGISNTPVLISQAFDWIVGEYAELLVEGEEFVRVDRTAGTAGERETAEYLAQKLASFGYESATSEPNGFEEFEFVSRVDGLNKTSQNVVFVKKGTSSANKVVVCASYDNRFGFVSVEKSFAEIREDTGAGNILAVLSVAYQLKDLAFPFDVEIVFFGAGEHGFAGSYFHALSFDKEEKESILLALNVDRLSDGEMFLYDDEIQTLHGKYVKNHFKNQDILVNRYHAGLSLVFEESAVLPFTHSGLNSNNVHFVNAGVKTVSILTASKDGYLASEYLKPEVVKPFIGSSAPSTLQLAATVATVVSELFQRPDFASKMLLSSTKDFSFWINKLNPVFATAGVIILAWFFYSIWFGKLFNKLRFEFGQKRYLDSIFKEIDKKIDESENDQLKKNKTEIKRYFEEDLSRKYEKDRHKEPDQADPPDDDF